MNGLLVTVKCKPVVSKGIHEDYTVDDVHVALVSASRTEGEPEFCLKVWIGGMHVVPEVIEVEPLLTMDDLHVQIYKVDCSSGTCEKHVLGEKYGK